MPLIKTYNKLLESGKLLPDDAQEAVLVQLATLAKELRRYADKRDSFFSKLSLTTNTAPQGAFIVGRVGRGKTMAMDLFFEHVEIRRKKRVHFHEFMQTVHKEIHTFRKLGAADPVEQVARSMAKNALLLCFDEFEVKDVTDAMILSKLFGTMISEGVVLVFTSNKVPLDHYKTGLQRQSYVDFCEELQGVISILSLDSEQDYRQKFAANEEENYFIPLSYKSSSRLNERFKAMGGKGLEKRVLEVGGRTIEMQASGKIGWATFDNLCAKALGAADYLQIAKSFDALFLLNVPQMKAESRNEARRFVTMVDILYENKIKLVMTAEVEPENMYTSGSGDFEFKRTASRLTEMRSW